MKFIRAIVKEPCPRIREGITTANLGEPDYEKALFQHRQYVAVLQKCGLEVKVLAADNNFPDSTFVEDTALCTFYCAIITNPGAPSRKDEVNDIKLNLLPFYQDIFAIQPPGTVDAGDIMMTGSQFYIGLSARTNEKGAFQLIDILNKFDYTASTVELDTVLHLKTGISYLENNYLLVSGEFIGRKEFKNFRQIMVDDEEAYAANSLWVNDLVLVPSGFPKTKAKIEKAGYETIEVEMSEFQKVDGGLSCLSLRF